MYKHVEVTKVIREETLKTTYGSNAIVQIKSTDERFKDYPPYTIYTSMVGEMDQLIDFKVFEDDVFLCGFMRSGTTLMEEMIWLIVNDFDFKGAQETIRSFRFPYIEGYNWRRSLPGNENLPTIENVKRPRTMKTHAAVHFLPNEIYTVKPKIVYISRDVKDVAVSLSHFMNGMASEIPISLEEFLPKFMNDEVWATPYREFHQYYKNFDYENILHLTYESVVGDMEAAILRVAKFFGKKVSTENLELLKNHLKFDNMKKNKAVNNEEDMKLRIKMSGLPDRKIEGFIRKGGSGGYKNEMSQEWADKLDNWMREIS